MVGFNTVNGVSNDNNGSKLSKSKVFSNIHFNVFLIYNI